MSKVPSSELFETIVNEAFMGFVAWNTSTNSCVFANSIAKQQLEIPMDQDCDAISLDSWVPPQQKVRGDFRPFSTDLLNHEGFYQDIMISKANGMYFIANMGVKHSTIEGSNYVVLMIQDVTLQKKLQRDITAKQAEIKSAYEELIRQNSQLKELDIAKNRFIALTTHELRTPLSAMIASAEILKFGLYDGDEQRQEFTDRIYDQGIHLSELVNDILDFAKIQANRMEFYIQHRDLHETLRSEVESQESSAQAVNIELHLDDSVMSPQLCYFDSIRMKQVLSNILSNAIKYNKDKGWVRIRSVTTDDFVEISIQDSGKGISPDDQKKVFNEFETLGKVAQHHKGTGLGMPISKRLIEGMGGEIHLESEVGVGSTFKIKVPINKVLEDTNYRDRPDEAGDLVA